MASFTETPGGSWRVQIENRGKREYKTFKNKSLANRWASQREAELARGMVASADDAQRTPFSEVIETYRKKVLPTKRNRSDRFTLNTLEKRFARTRLIALYTKDIADFRDDQLAAGKAPATVVKELNLLRVVIDYAIRDMGIYLPANPARLVKNPTVRNSRDRVFIADEEKRLFAEFKTPMLKAIARLALETACRLGELLNMDWQDIDFAKRTLHIPKTKTDTTRTIPLSAVALKELKKLPRPIDGGRVFSCWKRGDSFENSWKRALSRAQKSYEEECKNAGDRSDPRILADLRFHDFRHIATSRLARVFPNVIELSRITGHKDLSSLNRYYHIAPEELAARLR